MSLMKNKALFALTLLLWPPGAADAAPLPLTDVFVGGNDGYPAYRIPEKTDGSGRSNRQGG